MLAHKRRATLTKVNDPIVRLSARTLLGLPERLLAFRNGRDKSGTVVERGG